LIEVTPQEEQLLNSLVERVNQTQLQEKDPDAETLLNRAFGPNPDAHYILAQTVLVQNIALEQAKAQVAQLQQQVAQAQQQAQPSRATSFLGGLLGHHDPVPQQPPPQQGYTPVAQAQPVYGQTAPGYQPVTQPGYAPVSQPQYMPAGQPQFVPVGGGQPSFMRGAMQTAAGVAAGALAFEGVEAVLHGIGGMGHPGYGWGGMGGGGFGGGGMMGAGFERPAEETVVNNYYDQPGEHGSIEHGGVEHAAGDHPWHDAGTQVADQGGAQFENASYNTSGDDRGSEDAGNADTGNADDGSGFDDGGSDNGSGFDDGSGGGSDDGGGGFGGDDGGGGY
jgi:hypothetical protein